MKNRVAIAISGGIDSLMAAYLLKKNGDDIFGIHFISGYEKTTDRSSINRSIQYISNQLDIPIEIIDCHTDFKENVVDYFTHTYLKGATPNPCLVCNPTIKFGTLLDFAIHNGADFLATGHYARIQKDKTGNFHLYKGKDALKDQSYFLSFLSQEKLSRARFPLGAYTKEEIKDMACKNNLSPISSAESQDICFIPGNNYSKFLEKQPGFDFKPGNIENIRGDVIGRHNGLHLFTIGQRRGINCPAEKPYYVSKIDTNRNILVVGFKENLMANEFIVSDINWISEPFSFEKNIYVKLRYRHNEVACTLSSLEDKNAIVTLNTPAFPITPGQGAVFYEGDEILGAGIIKRQI